MFLSNASLKRPIAMTAFIVVLLLAGLNSYRKIGLNNMPAIDMPFVTINTIYPGASPNEIEVDVAKKIEDAVSTIDGLKHLNSSCMENMCQTLLEFNLDVDADVAAVDVRERVDLILDDLPKDVKSPKILKFDPNAKPIVTLLLTGDLPLDSLYDYADETLSDRLSTISGVANVQILGGEKLELHITLNKEKLASKGLTVLDVVNKLSQNNLKIPSGSIKDGIQEISVTFDSEFKNIDELKSLEIGNDGRCGIYLRDIANVKMISKENRTKAFYNGKSAINLKIIKKGEANAVRVIQRIHNTIDNIKDKNLLPGGMKLIWFADDAAFIQASVNDAWGNIFIGLLLTALILFIFLHEIRSTIIVSVSMPASLIITYSIMKYFDYTFNTSTLLALGTSVGILVTNSIVVIEHIFSKMHIGLPPIKAAEEGVSGVALPVFASAMTNVVVFIPIAMMSSLVGRFFIPFAITITAATLVSLFISFTMTPILSSLFLKEKEDTQFALMRLFIKYWNKFYSKCEHSYSLTIHKLSKHPWISLLITLLLLILTMVYIAPRVGSSFFPDNDRGEFIIKLEFPTDYNINTTIKRTLEIENILRVLPEVLRTSIVVGKVQGIIGQASVGVYLAEITIKTTDKTSRTMQLEDMRKMFRDKLKEIPNLIYTVGVPSAIGGASAQIELEILGDDLNILEKLGKNVSDIAETSGLAVDVDNSIRIGKPEIRIMPKRTILQDLRLPASFIGTNIRGYLEGIEVGTYKIGDKSYDIRVELEEYKGEKSLEEFTFTSINGQPLNIPTVCSLTKGMIPIQISRSEKRRIVKIFANHAKGVPLSNLVSFLAKQVKKNLPSGYEMRFVGQVETMKEAQTDFMEAILIAIILTYLLIVAILESWTMPFLILTTLPLALIGLFIALFFTGNSLSIMGLLGAVMLIGIVVNNAILIMDELIILIKQGIPKHEAMLMAAQHKFRPIIMTSLAAILGMLPMAFGTGIGSELRSSCGMGIVGGLISSTILSLIIIPMMYIQFIKEKENRI